MCLSISDVQILLRRSYLIFVDLSYSFACGFKKYTTSDEEQFKLLNGLSYTENKSIILFEV